MIDIGIGIPMPSIRRSGYSSQAQQFFDRAPDLTAKNDKDHYATIIDAFVATGIWDKMDHIHLFSSKRENDVPLQAIANLNLIGPDFTAVPTNSPGFDYKGYTGNGTNAYVDSGFNPQNSEHFYETSAMYSTWNLLDRPKSATAIAGAQDIFGSSVSIYPFAGPDEGRFVSAINDEFNAGVTVNTSLGMRSGNRSSPTARQGYVDGVEYEDYPDSPSLSAPNLNIYILASNVNGSPLGFVNDIVPYDAAGGSLTAQQHVMLYQITRNHLLWTGAYEE